MSAAVRSRPWSAVVLTVSILGFLLVAAAVRCSAPALAQPVQIQPKQVTAAVYAKPKPAPVLFWAVDDRGDLPGTTGLSASVVVPAGLNVQRGRTAMVYEWRPKDPLPPMFADQMEPHALAEHVATLPDQLAVYVPDAAFDGYIVYDYELWDALAGNNGAAQVSAAAAAFPDFTWGELVQRFVTTVTAETHRLRPRCKGVGFFGWGGSNPPRMVNSQAFAAGQRRQCLRDAVYLRAMEVPVPTFYSFPCALADLASRARAFDLVAADFAVVWTGPVLTDTAICYVNACPIPSCAGPARFVSPGDLGECLDAGLRAGYTRFALWDALEDRAARDAMNKWVADVLAPALKARGFVKG